MSCAQAGAAGRLPPELHPPAVEAGVGPLGVDPVQDLDNEIDQKEVALFECAPLPSLRTS